MIHKLLEQIYLHLPFPLWEMAGSLPVAFRFGRSFKAWSEFIKSSEFWDAWMIEEHQIRALREIAQIAFNTTSYWKNSFDKAGVRPETIDYASLIRLPICDSRTIKRYFEQMVSTKYKNRSYLVSTGGTGRNPTPIMLANEVFGIEWAFMYDQWRRVGYTWKERKATFRGKNIGDHLWQYNPVYNELLINVFRLSKDVAQSVFDQLVKWKPTFFHGYLSSTYIFAKYLQEAKIDGRLLRLKGILLGSENIFEERRAFLESFFGCRAYSWYGHSEKAVLGGECEESLDYHIFFQYGILEVVDSDGNPAKKGRLIATTLINKAMPLFRYDTGDYGELVGGECRSCHRHYTLLNRIQGRWGADYVYDVGGNPLSTSALNLHVPEQKYILNLQIVQERIGEIDVLVSVLGQINRQAIIDSLRQELNGKLGRKFGVRVVLVADENITRSRSGKIPFLIQKVNTRPSPIPEVAP